MLALGGVTNYYSNRSCQEYGFACKTMPDALRLRNHIINLLEAANRSSDPEQRRRLLTFVQAGAGCTGLEVLTELREFLHSAVPRYYHNLDFERDVRLVLVEGLPKILASLPDALAEKANRKLERKGVEMRLNTLITGAGPGWVELDGKETIETETLIWVTGITANPLVADLPVEHDKMGRVKVDQYMQVPGYPGVFAIGDNAHFVGQDGEPLDPTAQVAVQQGPALARNLVARFQGKPMQPFRFHYRGELVTIGSLDAVCSPYGWNIAGLTGWLLFKWVYFSKMPTMQNRFRLLSDWLLHALQGPSISLLEHEGVEPCWQEREEAAPACEPGFAEQAAG